MIDTVCERYKQSPSEYLDKDQHALLFDYLIALTGIKHHNEMVDDAEQEDDKVNEMREKLKGLGKK